MHDRVVCRLVECDIQSIGAADRVVAMRVERRLLGDDVEILAQSNLGVHVGEAAGEGLGGGLVKEERLRICRIGGGGEEEVADQDCRVLAEVGGAAHPLPAAVVIGEETMRRGGSPTLVRAIDNVIVNEGTGLVELECGTQVGEKHLAQWKPGG